MRTLVIFTMLGLIGCGKVTSEPLFKDFNVALNESVTTVVGHSWPIWSTGYADATAIQEPLRVTISFADGRKLESISKVTFLRQKEDRVCSVNISPLLEETRHEDAAKVVRAINRKLAPENFEAIDHQLLQWETNQVEGNPTSSISFRAELKDGVTAFIEIRAGNIPNKWIVSYEFTIDDAYRKKNDGL